MPDDKKKIQFHYQKSALFRVIHADGVWGGVTPDLDLYFSIFTQRPPIPQMVVHAVNEDGTLSEEISEARVGKTGVVREIEVGVTISPDTLDRVIEWLSQQRARITEIQDKQRLKDGPSEPRNTDTLAS